MQTITDEGSLRGYGVSETCEFSDFPSKSIISRFLSRVRVSGTREIAAFNFGFVIKCRTGCKGFGSITFDLDSHVTTVYGNLQRAAAGYNLIWLFKGEVLNQKKPKATTSANQPQTGIRKHWSW